MCMVLSLHHHPLVFQLIPTDAPNHTRMPACLPACMPPRMQNRPPPLFRQLYEESSSTYTYILADPESACLNIHIHRGMGGWAGFMGRVACLYGRMHGWIPQ